MKISGVDIRPGNNIEYEGGLFMADDIERLEKVMGKRPEITERSIRFRTLGCFPLTGAVESEAATLPEIIQEMLLTTTSERQGRVIDHDGAGSMEEKMTTGSTKAQFVADVINRTLRDLVVRCTREEGVRVVVPLQIVRALRAPKVDGAGLRHAPAPPARCGARRGAGLGPQRHGARHPACGRHRGQHGAVHCALHRARG